MLMLINGTQKDELRVAIVESESKEHDGSQLNGSYKLVDVDIGRIGYESKKGNIYRGKITRLEPGLDAVFVDYGAERHGFLPLKEIAPEYFIKSKANVSTDYDNSEHDAEKFNVRDVVREGQEILVQIVKEERGNKGAALTTFISLAGCFLVFMPNNPRAGGISRRIEGDERDEMRGVLSQLDLPAGASIIIRTAGVGRNFEDLQWDLSILKHHWEAIQKAGKSRPAPFLIHREGDVVTRSIRDYLRKEVSEIIIDQHDIFVRVHNYIQLVRPDFASRVRLYQDPVPLFIRYLVEEQIESAFQREVRLPSGGAIVIDRTEALVAIDVNSAKSTKGGDIEETALNTNLEAVEAIARYIRLRDEGGLIVIDLIDMTPDRNKREVENRLREALKPDRARVQVSRISRFGLLEMSRQRLRPTLAEFNMHACPHCKGLGTVRSIDSLGISMLRKLEESAMRPNVAQIQLHVPVEVSAYLSNERRPGLVDIEQRHQVNILIIPNTRLHGNDYKLSVFRTDEATYKPTPSYELVDIEEEVIKPINLEQALGQEPAIKDIYETLPVPPTPAQQIENKPQGPGLIKRLLNNLFHREPEGKKTIKNSCSESSASSGGDKRSNNNRHNPPRRGGSNTRDYYSSGSRRGGHSLSAQRRKNKDRGYDNRENKHNEHKEYTKEFKENRDNTNRDNMRRAKSRTDHKRGNDSKSFSQPTALEDRAHRSYPKTVDPMSNTPSSDRGIEVFESPSSSETRGE